MIKRNSSEDPDVLSRDLSKCRDGLLAVFVFSLFVNLLMLTTPIYLLQVFDRVLASHSLETLALLTLIAGGAVALLSVLDILRGRLLTGTGVWLERRLSPTALERALEAALGNRNYRTESLRDLASLRSFVTSTAVITLFDAPWVPLYLAFVYMLHPLLGHVAFAGATLLFALAFLNDRVTRRPLKHASLGSMKNLSEAELSLRNAEAIDAMGLLPGIRARWVRSNDLVLNLHTLAGNRASIVLGLSRFWRLFVQIALLGCGAWLVVRYELTAGGMIAASIIMGRALAPVEQAIGVWKQAANAREAYQRLKSFFSSPPLRCNGLPLPAPHGHVAVENVTYLLPGGKRPILLGVSFEVHPGEALAILGPSAAGKSSLARLLVGVRQPSGGTVRLDGADVFAWRRDDVGRHIGYLPQDVELFGGSVAENIARMSKVDPAAIVRAAQLAHAHEMILRLPEGYATEIGEGGTFLSGGQYQRVALARALFGEPKLIVLDEPNSNLDAEGTEALNKAIAAMKKRGSAVVIIGHASSILAEADKVLVLAGGQVVEFGPRMEILKRIARRSLVPVPGAGSSEIQTGASTPARVAVYPAE